MHCAVSGYYIKKGFLICLLAALSGCGNVQSPPSTPVIFKRGPINFAKSGWQAQMVPLEEPVPLSRPTTFKLYLWSESIGGSVNGPYGDPGLIPHVWLYMRMASGSHGSVKVQVTPSLDANGNSISGVYDVRNVVFTMAGPWDIHIELKNTDGTVAYEFVHIVEV